MGKKQRDCIGCGAPVGFIGREYCCRCMQGIRDAAARQPCPGCGQNLILQATGRCVRCSRRCSECGGPVKARDATVCRPCVRKAERQAAKAECPRCGSLGFIRADTGWCGTCSRPGPPKKPPRICRVCGEVRRHAGLGMCGPCWQRDEGRAQIRGDHLLEELADPPVWLPAFVGYLADRHCPARAAAMIGLLAKLLNDENPNNPQAVLERGRRPGRSMGSLARAMQDFFVERGLALPTDQAERLAAGRRQRRIDAVPAPLRPAVQAFSTEMMKNKQRARAAATRPRSDQTIEMTLGALRDLAVFLDSHRGKSDWSLVDVHDLEAFVDALPKTRSHSISLLRQFFRFARSRRIVLVDPTRGLTRNAPRGFTGQTLTLNKQRDLFRRWTSDPAVHPHEALMGLLALLHGASGAEVRMLCSDDIDPIHRSIRLANDRSQCRWIRRPGRRCNTASCIVNPSTRETLTWS